MSTATINLDELNVSERVELLGRVWDSLVETNWLPPIPGWHARELAKRIARADAEPSTSIPLEQLRAELLGGKP